KELHLCLRACFVKGDRIENIVPIFCEWPRASKRIIAGSSNKGMESIRTLTGGFKALVRISDIYGGIVSEVWWERAERQLNFQISRQRLGFVSARGLLVLCARCERQA